MLFSCCQRGSYGPVPSRLSSSPAHGPQSLVCPHPTSLAVNRALCTDHEGGLDGLSSGLPVFDSLPPPLFFHSWSGFLVVLLCGRCRSLFSWPRPGIRESLAKGFPLWTSLLPLGLTQCMCTIQESLSMQLEDGVRLGSPDSKPDICH